MQNGRGKYHLIVLIFLSSPIPGISTAIEMLYASIQIICLIYHNGRGKYHLILIIFLRFAITVTSTPLDMLYTSTL